MRTSATADPFGTESIRARVLDTWRATPARFREDANAEQDYALGAYRDRTIIELLQNASDAGIGSETAGHVAIRLTSAELLVSNSGAELTVEGVAALASLRASAKREVSGAVGRFGVGFAAVLAVSDEPVVASTSGAIRFSKTATRELVEAETVLSDELTRREDELPILRLPFATHGAPLDGFTTTITLPLRSGAFQRVEATLDEVDALTLLALPGISRLDIEVEGELRTLSIAHDDSMATIVEDGTSTQWQLRQALIEIPRALASELPVEERGRTHYRMTWALPVDPTTGASKAATASRVHAPTMTDEPLNLPAALIADIPLDPSRRRVRVDEVARHVLRRAASEYADLVVQRAKTEGRAALALIPEQGFFGEIDALLRAEIRELLSLRPLLRSAADPEKLLTGSQAIVVRGSNDELVMQVATQIPDVVAPDWADAQQALQLLNPRELTLADALDSLIEVRASPRWWFSLYEAVKSEDLGTLAGLPVLLADGSLTRDVRGTVDAGDSGGSGAAASLQILGLKVIHPEAMHPLLLRLGATVGEPGDLLRHPAVLQRLTQADDESDMLAVALATLSLVDGMSELAETPIRSRLKLPCIDGEFRVVAQCVVPGSQLADMLASEGHLVDVPRLGDVGAQTLMQVGALTTLTVERHFEVPFEPDAVAALTADGADWQRDAADLLSEDVSDEFLMGGLIGELSVVAGLELVADESWDLHRSILSTPPIRGAIVTPTQVLVGGSRYPVPSPAAWWLKETPVFYPRSPTQVRVAGDDRLVGLLPEVEPDGLPDDVLVAIGVRVRLEEWLDQHDGAGELLERLAVDDLRVDPVSLSAIYLTLSRVEEHEWPDPPVRVRVPDGEGTVLVSSSEVTVVTAPHHLPLFNGPVLLGPEALADILDVTCSAQALADVDVDSESGAVRSVPAEIANLIPGIPGTYLEHDELLVKGVDLQWWVEESGVVHAATTHGLARGLAWSSGHWHRRWELLALLAEPELAEQAREERSFD